MVQPIYQQPRATKSRKVRARANERRSSPQDTGKVGDSATARDPAEQKVEPPPITQPPHPGSAAAWSRADTTPARDVVEPLRSWRHLEVLDPGTCALSAAAAPDVFSSVWLLGEGGRLL